MGPSADGRIKPDVVGTGFKIVSAMAGDASSRSCGVYESFGTSMATPIVAGGALLLRDYFLNLWPSVCRSSYGYCKSFEPTGYLLKGIIIHSAVPVTSYSDPMFDYKTDLQSYTLSTSSPDYVQGYGAVNLHTTVPLTSAERNKHDLYVSDKTSITSGSTLSLHVTVFDNSKPLKVTVVWYDMPSAVNSANNLLILNLDLQVESKSSGALWYGNGVNSDIVNPQEQVVISSPTADTYYIRIINTGSYDIMGGIIVSCHGKVVQGGTQSNEHDMDLTEEIHGEDDDNAVTLSRLSQLDTFDSTSKSLYSKTFIIANTLPPLSPTQLGTFQITGTGYKLDSVDVRLDSTYIVGSEAYILGIIIHAPNGEVVQLGGYNLYITVDRFLNKLAPVHFTQLTSPYDGSGYYSYSRDVSEMGLSDIGTYKVYINLLHSTWDYTSYHGSVTINFKVQAPSPTRYPTRQPTQGSGDQTSSPTSPQQSSDNTAVVNEKSTVAVGFLVFGVSLGITFCGAILFKKYKKGKLDQALEQSGDGQLSHGEGTVSPLQVNSLSASDDENRTLSDKAYNKSLSSRVKDAFPKLTYKRQLKPSSKGQYSQANNNDDGLYGVDV